MKIRTAIIGLAGVFALLLALDLSGVLPGVGAQTLPLIVLLAAALLIMRAVRPAEAASNTAALAVPRDGADRASLSVTFGAGRLALAGGAEADSLLAGQCAGAVRERTRRERTQREGSGEAAITLGQPLAVIRRRADWRLALNPAVGWTRIALRLGASTADLDLRDLAVEDVLLETGGTTLTVQLPRQGTVTVQIGGGQVELIVPPGVPTVIDSAIRLGEVIVEDKGLAPAGDGLHWATPDAAGEAGKLHLVLKGGLGVVKIAPPPGATMKPVIEEGAGG